MSTRDGITEPASKLGPHPTETEPKVVKPAPPLDPPKLDNLRAQRRARGECFKCGCKYGVGHKCPQNKLN